jgi:hypothetical protein
MKDRPNKAPSGKHDEASSECLTMVQQVFLDEIRGKNAAIQSYDDIIWKIRTGYLTLLFAGWAILLEGMIGRTQSQDDRSGKYIAILSLVSLGLTIAGFYIDRSYSRRKARVIHALDRLTHEVVTTGGDVKKIPLDLLNISGDDPHATFDEGRFQFALRKAALVYFVPFVTVLLAGAIVLLTK